LAGFGRFRFIIRFDQLFFGRKKMTRLVVAEIAENAGRNLDVECRILGRDVELSRFAFRGDSDELAAYCQTADVILTDFVPFGRSVIEKLQNCQLISVAATGYNSIDLQAAKAAGISVCALDEYCTEEVADHVMLLILALCRRLTEYQCQVQREKCWQFDVLSGLRRLRGMTLGIVGFGRIGQAVAKRAAGFGCRLLAYDLRPNEVVAKAAGVAFCSLSELFRQSDIISLNCSLANDGGPLINARAFAEMKRKPVLINCARGGLIDERALLLALDSGQISAAGLDVLFDESPDLSASDLTGRSNVILTPHVAFYSDESMLENRSMSAGNIRNFLDGKHDDVRQYIVRCRQE
jgi:D-3-phosphoglycerate dehydrogenase